MNRACIRYLWLFPVAAALLLQSCASFKLIKPEQQIISSGSTGILHPEVKVSYSLKALPSGRPAGWHVSPILVEKALLDALAANGIRDVVKSEKLEQDRINIVGYVTYGAKEVPHTASFLELPWMVISFASLALVPYYAEWSHPAEIHIVAPAREFDRQIKIIQTEYVVERWIWLPILFIHKSETPEEVDNRMSEKLDYLGWRRVFEGVVRDLLKE